METDEKSNRTLGDIEDYIKRHGKKGQEKVSRILSSLGKSEQFLNAIQSPLGTELLTDLISMMEEKLDKIINETADDKDRADYRACKILSLRWADRINAYNKNLTELKEK